MFKDNGFTLIELMMVVTIVGILASIAYPSYKRTMYNSYRSSAKAALFSASVEMENHYQKCYTYCGIRSDLAGVSCDDGKYKCLDDEASATTIFSEKIPEFAAGEGVRYNLEIRDLNKDAYTLHAVPANDQENDDRCSVTLTLSHTGEKEPKPPADAPNDCW